MTYEPCYADPEKVAAWNAKWEATCARRWVTDGSQDGGYLLHYPIAGEIPLVVPNESARTILELERELNDGRQLSPAKEKS